MRGGASAILTQWFWIEVGCTGTVRICDVITVSSIIGDAV